VRIRRWSSTGRERRGKGVGAGGVVRGFVAGEVLAGDGAAAVSLSSLGSGSRVAPPRSLWTLKSKSVHACSMSARPRRRIAFFFRRQCGRLCLDGRTGEPWLWMSLVLSTYLALYCK